MTVRDEVRIVERCSGYWVVDNTGVIDGPFENIVDAVNFIEELK